MTLEELLDAVEPHLLATRGQTAHVDVWRARVGGGYTCTVNQCAGYGDTVADALQAAHDHVMSLPPRRARLNPPYFTSDQTDCNWNMALRIAYDYRARDWVPPEHG